MTKQDPLLDVRSLAARLDDPAWVVVDCRFTLTDPAAGRAAYDAAHIPGARYADLDRDLSRRPAPSEGRHPLPAPRKLAQTLGRLGIDDATTVVAYDEGSGAIAARLWWLLRWLGHERSYLLDGGFAAWLAAELPVESDAPRVAPKRFVGRKPNLDAVLETDDLRAFQRAGGIVLDARGAARYRGEQEPIDRVAGHIPGALSAPFTELLGADGRVLPAADLKRKLDGWLAGRAPSAVAASCGSGVTACLLLLAMSRAGLAGGRLYAGSWSEWIRDPSRPVRTGPDP